MSNPIPILRTGLGTGAEIQNPQIVNTDVDFNDLSVEDLENLEQKAQEIGGNVANNQLTTQSHVVSLYGPGRPFPNVEKVVDVDQIRGKQFSIPENVRMIKVTSSSESSPCPFVLSEIQGIVVVQLFCRVSQLTITNCRKVLVRMSHAPIAGIECINSHDVTVVSAACNFLRVTTSTNVKFRGECDADSLLDIRNCTDIHVNDAQLEVGMFSEGRFSVSPDKDHFIPIEPQRDLWNVGVRTGSFPNLTLLK